MSRPTAPSFQSISSIISASQKSLEDSNGTLLNPSQTPPPPPQTTASNPSPTSAAASQKSGTKPSSVKTSIHTSTPTAAVDPSQTSPTASSGSLASQATTFVTSASSGSNQSATAVAAESQTTQCSGISCSPALKAAIAVPVALVGLGIIIAFFIFAWRKRNRDPEKREGTRSGQKWTRHLRMFSFDAELLVGGHSNGSRSFLSRSPQPSTRAAPSVRSEPSMTSVEQAAPAYRDALSHPNPLAPIIRPESRATAPPPYVSRAEDREDEVQSITSSQPSSNPFRSAAASPVNGDDSPFADPPDEARRHLSPVSLSRTASDRS